MTKREHYLQRKAEMAALRNDPQKPLTLQQIADRYGVSRQRIHQILGNTGRPGAKAE